MDETTEVSKALILRVLQSRIYELRGQMVMLDSDLAELYGVETKNLNKAVARNSERFPADFMFQLTEIDSESLRFQIGTSKPRRQNDEVLSSQSQTLKENRGGRRYLPYVFTEQGVAMLSGVLRSERAVKVNIAIMRACIDLPPRFPPVAGLAGLALQSGQAGLGRAEVSELVGPTLRRKSRRRHERENQ